MKITGASARRVTITAQSPHPYMKTDQPLSCINQTKSKVVLRVKRQTKLDLNSKLVLESQSCHILPMQPLASHVAFLSLTFLPYKMEIVSTTRVHWRQWFTNYGPGTRSTRFTWKFVKNANTDQLILKLRGWGSADYVWPSRWCWCSGLKPLGYGLCVLLHAECHLCAMY